jgi:hypothetical protein
MPRQQRSKKSAQTGKAGKPVRTRRQVDRPTYDSNRKHKEPWQPGRKGSLCPNDMTPQVAQKLLEASDVHEERRFAVHDGRAYRGHEHEPGLWHGFPVGWKEVPPQLRIKWVNEHRVSRADVKRYWD